MAKPQSNEERIAPRAPPDASVLALIERQVSAISNSLKEMRKGDLLPSDLFVRSLQAMTEKLDVLTSLRGDLQRAVEEAAHRDEIEFLQLEADIRDAAARRAWHVEGQWPTLYIQRGIDVTVNESARTVTVGGVKLLSHSLKSILESLEANVSELIPDKFDAQAFVDLLAHAYDALATPESRQVPTFEVYRQLVIDSQSNRFWRNARSDEFREMSIVQFRARLSESLNKGVHRATDGRDIRLIPPLNPKDALFVFLPAERRFAYVGRIEFVLVGGDSSV